MLAQLQFCFETARHVEPFLKFFEKDDIIMFKIYPVFKQLLERILIKILDVCNISKVIKDKSKLPLKMKPAKFA